MRSIRGRVRALVSNRRRAVRHAARLPLVVSLAQTQAGHALPMKGHTRDISEAGVGIVVPPESVEGRNVVGEGRPLRVTLRLDKREIQVSAVAVRHAPLATGSGESGLLIGARITGIGEGERALLAKHLRKLRFPVRDYAP